MRGLLMAAACLAAALTSPALAQMRPDPAEQAVVGSVQELINKYEEKSAALAAAQKELECWRRTSKACAAAEKPRHP